MPHPGQLRASRKAGFALAFRHSFWAVGFVYLLAAFLSVRHVGFGVDAHAYWAAWSHHLYGAPPEQPDAFLYSPAFAEALWPLTRLPWQVFDAVWTGLLVGVYLWLLAPLPWRWRAPALLVCTLDMAVGNIWSLYALVLVLGFRRPALWAFPALTKVTPMLGPVWFAARREWRPLIVSLVATLLVVAVSVAVAPDLWVTWLRFLLHTQPHWRARRPVVVVPAKLLLAVGMSIAVGLTVYAARTNRRWLLPVALVFTAPVITAGVPLVLAAIPRLYLQRDEPAAAAIARLGTP